jgi:hypothetical protein
MRSINEQLNIAVPRNINIPSRYTRGLFSAQPQLDTEDWSLDNYNDIRSLSNMHNADGEDYSNVLALLYYSYPACAGKTKDVCRKCKSRCKASGLKWRKGGKECYNACKAQSLESAEMPQSNEVLQETQNGGNQGMSTGAKVAIGIGALAVLGTAIYLITKK